MSKRKRSDSEIPDLALDRVPASVPAWPTQGELIAKRDFEIHWNDYHRVIKTGDDLSDVPEMFYENLKTEKVI